MGCIAGPVNREASYPTLTRVIPCRARARAVEAASSSRDAGVRLVPALPTFAAVDRRLGSPAPTITTRGVLASGSITTTRVRSLASGPRASSTEVAVTSFMVEAGTVGSSDAS